jgi:hypothetical protein
MHHCHLDTHSVNVKLAAEADSTSFGSSVETGVVAEVILLMVVVLLPVDGGDHSGGMAVGVVNI